MRKSHKRSETDRKTTDRDGRCGVCGSSLATNGRVTADDGRGGVRVLCAGCADDVAASLVGDTGDTPTVRLYLTADAWPFLVRLVDRLAREIKVDENVREFAEFDDISHDQVKTLAGRIDPDARSLAVDETDTRILTAAVGLYRGSWCAEGWPVDDEIVDHVDHRVELARGELALGLTGVDA